MQDLYYCKPKGLINLKLSLKLNIKRTSYALLTKALLEDKKKDYDNSQMKIPAWTLVIV